MSNDLSRRSSRQLLVAADDTTSLTSFPDPESTSPTSPSLQGISPEPVVTGNGENAAPRKRADSQPLDHLLDAGPSMFDRHEIDIGNPQHLSAASTESLQRIIEHRGALELVRQLSVLLAERDAHVTALARLAEEYKIPKDRIVETSNRVKQAERRRLSLANAASEEVAPTNTNTSASSTSTSPSDANSKGVANGTIRGLTRLFGGTGTIKRRDSPHNAAASLKTGSSSRSNSMGPPPSKSQAERPKSVDVQSINSVASGDSMGWTTSLFSGAAGTIKGLSGGHRRDSRASREPREPIEMSTRHDEAQLPPTLTRPSLSQPTKDPHEAEWNRFLQRLMRSREQSGEEEQGGEIIGASRFGNEGSSGRQKMEVLTRLILSGIPMRWRHQIWMELTNTHAIMQPDAYKFYLTKNETSQDDPQEIDAILKDVPRTLTSKYDYYAEKGYDRLRRLLVAFVNKYPGLGYTQGLNMIAGYLLLAIPSESDAFWLLCNMVDTYFPPAYFSKETSLQAPISDNIILRQYITTHLPKLSSHLESLHIEPENTVPLSWFLTSFASVMSEPVLLRIWDVWLCLPSQKTFIFNIALTLLQQHQPHILECESAGDFFSYMSNKIKGPGEDEGAKIDELIRQAFLWRRKLEGVEVRGALEGSKVGRRTGSMEALRGVSPEGADARVGSSEG